MSWGEWANRCMTYQGFPSASEGAIVGINGGMWGKTDNSNIDISVEDTKEFHRIIKGQGDFKLIVGGQKYVLLRGFGDDSGVIIAKKNQDGITIAKAVQCFVVALYKEGVHPNNNTAAVTTLRDQLMQNSY